MVAAVLSHSASVSGNKWFHWVILAKVGEIISNFLHNYSMPDCINSWRWNTTVVGLLNPMIIISNGPCGTSIPFQHLPKFIFIATKWLCSTQWLAGNKEKKSSQHLMSMDTSLSQTMARNTNTTQNTSKSFNTICRKCPTYNPVRSRVTPQKEVARMVLKAPSLTHQTHMGLWRKSRGNMSGSVCFYCFEWQNNRINGISPFLY